MITNLTLLFILKDYIDKSTINSIFFQTYKNYKLIILDLNYKNKDFFNNINNDQIQYYNYNNISYNNLFNEALKLCKTKYTMIIHNNVTYNIDCLEQLTYFLDNCNWSNLVCGGYKINNTIKIIKNHIPLDFLLNFDINYPIMFRTELSFIDNNDTINTELLETVEFDYYLKILEKNNHLISVNKSLININEPIIFNNDSIIRLFELLIKRNNGLIDVKNYYPFNNLNNKHMLCISNYDLAMKLLKFIKLKKNNLNNINIGQYFELSYKYNNNFIPSLINLIIFNKKNKKEYNTYNNLLNKSTIELYNNNLTNNIYINFDISKELTTIKNKIYFKRNFREPTIINIKNEVSNNNVINKNKILIYNGIDKNRENVVEKVLYNEIIKKVNEITYKNNLPFYEFIFSNNLTNTSMDEIDKIYSKCSICLFLIDIGRDSYILKKIESFGIPIISNFYDNAIKWNLIDDIIFKININNDNQKINMYELKNLNDNTLNKINENINIFNSLLSSYKNILFISGDYPGYGGAATNCSKLQEYYKNIGFNTFAFYYNFDKKSAKYEKTNDYVIDDLTEINNINFKPDLIILKSFINYNLKKKFNCPIFYLVGGIYDNNLDDYYFNLNTFNENEKYINNRVIKQIYDSDYTFVNSYHTQEILKKYYNLDTYLFYSSFISFHNKKPLIDNNFDNRKYSYGLIVSNFNRKIKNIQKSIEFLKEKNNVILIGKNSKLYEKYGFTCIELIDNINMKEYYLNIKYIVQDSFYESCSNVKIEALMNGCKIHE